MLTLNSLYDIGKKAKKAASYLAILSTEEKNNALLKIADALENNIDFILDANKKDIENAKKNSVKEVLIDRLLLTKERISDIADGIRKIVTLDDPVGTVLEECSRPNGLKIEKMRVPLGVVGIIYEARPNVTADAASLTLKSGNAVILRGGKEAINSNIAIVKVMSDALKDAGLPDGTISLVEDISRDSALNLMKMDKYLDVIIPRGGANLIRSVVENSTVPAIQTGTGNCHIYVDEFADFKKALDIIINAKTSRPSVCNAAEKIVLHKNIADDFLKLIIPALREKNVEILGDKYTTEKYPDITLAKDDEWNEEFLDLKIAIKVAENTDDAIEHINTHSTMHSEAIITENKENAEKFLSMIDAAAVYHNASTRFTDGGEFGFGAEIGISTQKLHSRGPMGLAALTTYKYIIQGNGQVR